VDEIPQGALSLAFLDPDGLHLAFDTLRKLARIRTDLITLFPDHMDALRNWERHYLNDPASNLDKCLGTGADRRSILDSKPRTQLAAELRKLYVGQIRTLGYSFFVYQPIHAKGHALYVLILRARHELAVQLWRAISEKEPNGHRRLW
jgi:three-Cys-motif partner protein